MEIIFRPMAYEPNISPVQRGTGYVLSLEADTISVTANPAAGSPLWMVVSRFNVDQARVRKAATKSNKFSKIAVLENISPRIFLVPKTQGHLDASALIDELLEVGVLLLSGFFGRCHAKHHFGPAGGKFFTALAFTSLQDDRVSLR